MDLFLNKIKGICISYLHTKKINFRCENASTLIELKNRRFCDCCIHRPLNRERAFFAYKNTFFVQT